MLICYIDQSFHQSTLDVIDAANEIIGEYEAEGYSMTLRQLYYQFVSKDLIPNTMRDYKRLVDIMNKARLAGLVSWESLEDRTRGLEENPHFEQPTDAIKSLATWYEVNKWADQHYRPEVWIEKDALVGVIKGICEDLDVPYYSCRGYNSQSEQWRAGQRFLQYMRRDLQQPIVFHLGDHDPSGLDMTRDNQKRLSLFAGCDIEVRRLALNMDQIEEYNPPPNPAKLTDTRSTDYIEQYGRESWELDALAPSVIRQLIVDAISSIRDDELWDEMLAEQEKHRDILMQIAKDNVDLNP